MLLSYALGQQSIILRIKLVNSSVSNNVGVVNIANNTPGLNIGTIADNETTGTIYSSATSTIDSITTIGVFATPLGGHCNFRQIDPTNFAGIYELQIDNSRYNISGSKSLIITISAINAFNVAQGDFLVPLVADDPYIPKPANFNLSNIDATGRFILQPIGLDAIVKDGYTIPQHIAVIAGMVGGESSGLPSSPATFKSLNGAATRAVIAFDANSNRLSSIITAP